MSSERFRSVKCNENIFVWKCHNQHSCALRTVLGKNWRPCQMHRTLASVRFIIYGFDWFLKVIECEMCILKLVAPTLCLCCILSVKKIWLNSLIIKKVLFSVVLGSLTDYFLPLSDLIMGQKNDSLHANDRRTALRLYVSVHQSTCSSHPCLSRLI